MQADYILISDLPVFNILLHANIYTLNGSEKCPAMQMKVDVKLWTNTSIFLIAHYNW